MTNKTVLVSGASIAGPVLAFWLHRFGFNVTIIERAPAIRLGGQNIDIKGSAQKIAQRMGIEDQIRAANTGELGVRFVDANDNIKAELPVGKSDLGTSELEILRGDLAKILYDCTRENVRYIFGDQITALEEMGDHVKVSFQKGSTQNFDLVICADGIRSRTRGLIFGEEPVIRSVNLYVAYLTIPRSESDRRWARWYNATGSRVITIRPDNEGTARAAFSFLSEPKGYENLSTAEQKQLLKDKFADAGWEAQRILDHLDDGGEVYFDSISQVIAPRWSKGRMAMVGDAAYCPTPLTGMGASLSFIGAYVLAGELSKYTDHRKAFESYESLLRPFVKKIQKLPPGVPNLAHPKTSFGIALFNLAINCISSKGVRKIVALFSGKKADPYYDGFDLPEYKTVS